MKSLLFILLCILALLGMSSFNEQEAAQDEKPPITIPSSVND